MDLIKRLRESAEWKAAEWPGTTPNDFIETEAADAIERLLEQLRLANMDAAINEARANDLEQSRQVPLPRGKFKDEEMIYSERLIGPEDLEEK